MAIRAVIFDYGMVLSQAQEPGALNNLLTITGLDRDTFDRHYWTHRHAYDMGKLNGHTYWKQFASDSAIELTATEIERLIENDVLMWCTINEPMLKWAKSLAESGLRIGILSNMGEDTLAYMRQEFSWLGDFDHHTWSCELGIAKPDPAIYTYTCEKLDVAPGEALFLDDKAENIRAAEEVGLVGIQFRDVKQLQRDLEARGLLDELVLPLG
ncbi:HAD family phosphatase [Alloacidobacterium dinghuense]|uniref:HAD family phosphatase n=1 Tax=Alloacidobacterium dinghuense TaxID=2763107 RepID=A0A7G8BPS7_9BACT|nr:HAD family phosphatase [Alloacidobacterium dinghuense]QNI34547.1 HAD family phosphatase [Alloacidobacterium dinghuense]